MVVKVNHTVYDILSAVNIVLELEQLYLHLANCQACKTVNITYHTDGKMLHKLYSLHITKQLMKH